MEDYLVTLNSSSFIWHHPQISVATHHWEGTSWSKVIFSVGMWLCSHLLVSCHIYCTCCDHFLLLPLQFVSAISRLFQCGYIPFSEVLYVCHDESVNPSSMYDRHGGNKSNAGKDLQLVHLPSSIKRPIESVYPTTSVQAIAHISKSRLA